MPAPRPAANQGRAASARGRQGCPRRPRPANGSPRPRAPESALGSAAPVGLPGLRRSVPRVDRYRVGQGCAQHCVGVAHGTGRERGENHVLVALASRDDPALGPRAGALAATRRLLSVLQLRQPVPQICRSQRSKAEAPHKGSDMQRNGVPVAVRGPGGEYPRNNNCDYVSHAGSSRFVVPAPVCEVAGATPGIVPVVVRWSARRGAGSGSAAAAVLVASAFGGA